MTSRHRTSMHAARRRGAAPAALLALALASAAAAGAPAHPQAAETWVATATAAHDPGGAVDLGLLRAGEPVDVAISLKVRDKARLDALTEALMTGAPGARTLSSEEFLARHSPTAAQARRVVDHLRAHGFTDIEVSANRLMVTARGSAGAAARAFRVQLHEYQVGERRAYANVEAAQLPASLAGVVLEVGGLQTVHRARTFAQAAPGPDQARTAASQVGVSPAAWPSIYGATTLPTAADTTVAIVTVGSMTQTLADLRTFTSNVGFAMPSVTTIPINGGSNDGSGTSEWDIDTQDSLGAAGGAVKSFLLYAAPSFSDAGLSAAYARAVSDNKAKVISVSIGGCETASSARATDNQTFQAAIAQGQTFAIASGDSGAYECGASGGNAQSWPAASPYVMAIGGTTMSTTGGNTWAGETAWSCSSGNACQVSNGVGYGGGGGGPSLTQSPSTAQKNSGVLGSYTGRGLPDISFDGNPATGAYITLNGSSALYGGTSLATPIFAGFFARMQSANANALAFPAATLYAGAAAHPEWFHDVTSGSQGWSAGTGWDFATGYGSLRVANFASAFGGGGGGGSELVVNGGFESGTTGWTSSTGVVCAAGSCANTESARSGANFAWLDGFGSAHTDTLSQKIAIPAGKTSATLTYWLHVDTAETGSTAYDKLTVQLLDASGKSLATLATYSNANAAAGYAQKSFDLSKYIGSTVTLKFTGVEDSNLQTSFVIDDVSLAVK